jgi:drug/metabolite transporter (DMT)-like permease
MILGCAFLTLNDTASKWETQTYPVGEVIFARSLLSFGFLLAIACATSRGRRALRVHSLRAQLMLALFSVSATALFVEGLQFLPLAESTALNLAGPLLVVAMAPHALGERVGPKLWLAALCGFAGVSLIVQPGAAVFHWAALLPLASAFSSALRDLATRRLHISESSTSMLLVSTLLLIVISPAIPSEAWHWVEPGDIAMLALAGAALAAANYCLIRALQLADASFIAPLRYSTLLWAIPLGAIVWHEWPGANVLLGSTLLIASGTYLFRLANRPTAADARSELEKRDSA